MAAERLADAAVPSKRHHICADSCAMRNLSREDTFAAHRGEHPGTKDFTMNKAIIAIAGAGL
ncbi:MAG: hypothetical protein ACK4MY_13920, partial [Brevundimonas sp.]